MNNKGGSGVIIIVLIVAVLGLIYINYLGGEGQTKDVLDKIARFSCPEVANITCDLGVDIYKDARGCTKARCKTEESAPEFLSEEGTLQVFFIELYENGDAIYIETPQEKRVIIDCGRGGDELSEFLAFRGIDKIDWLIVSHLDADHIGGCDEVFDQTVVLHYLTQNMSCSTEACENLFLAQQTEEGLDVEIGDANFVFDELDLKWEILNPNIVNLFSTPNDNSYVIKLTYGDVKVLFTGDCEEDCEEMMLRLGKDVSADVLKVSHHGSNTATTAEFLAAVNPATAILSYGMTNPYGHPHSEITDRFTRTNIPMIKLPVTGTTELRTDGTEIEWYCDKKKDCFS